MIANSIFMFSNNKDFYPTPPHVIELMGIDCAGKTVLEPQAGNGNIIEWLKANGAEQVICCEKHPDLAEVAKTKAKFLKHDFLKVTATEISHVNLIVMNPPFSKGIRHILHAWEVAPDGCEIISLFNHDNLTSYTDGRRELLKLIEGYGQVINLGNVFATAERKTNVEVGLVKLYKPKSGSNEFEGFFLDEDPAEAQGNGIMPFNKVRDVVQRYVAACQLFEEHEAIASKMSSLTDPFNVGTFEFCMSYNEAVTTKEDFKKNLQKKAWAYLFDTMNLNKYVTAGVMKDINKFVEQQENVPFTMKNIYKMFEIIVGTRQQTFNRAIVEAIDNFTRYTHENRYGVEGWKTNEGHLLTQKFIVPYMAETWGSRDKTFSTKHGSNHEKITDLVKVLCSITGTNYDDIISLSNAVRYPNRLYAGKKYVHCYDDAEWDIRELKAKQKEYYQQGIQTTIETGRPVFGQWFNWGFFKVRAYKKGTMHFMFTDAKVWELLNRKYAEIKGQVLPEKMKAPKTKQASKKPSNKLVLA